MGEAIRWWQGYWPWIGDSHGDDCRWFGRCYNMSTRRSQNQDTNASESDRAEVWRVFYHPSAGVKLEACTSAGRESPASDTYDINLVAHHDDTETGSCPTRYILCLHGSEAGLQNRRCGRVFSRGGTTIRLDQCTKWNDVGPLSNPPPTACSSSIGW